MQITDLHLPRITLWYLVQHSLSSYRKLIEHFGSAETAITPQHLKQWQQLKLHDRHLERANDFLTETGQQKFQHCLNLIQTHCHFVICEDDPTYPAQLTFFSDKPPILFGQGDVSALQAPQIAIVGSRKPSVHGPQTAYDFSYYLADKGFYITSGMANGIDHAAHQGGLQFQRTIAVVGTGLDQVYPAQNRALQQQILQQQGTIISEFLPTTPPLQHHFPRRNRIISALSLGTLVIEAAIKSGSLSTARWAMEQGKPVFAIPGHIYNEHHQGCHQLIREGASLVDHPEQLIQELQSPLHWHLSQSTPATSPQPNPNVIKPQANTVQPSSDSTSVTTTLQPTIQLPPHLALIYQALDWQGRHLDDICYDTQLAIDDVTAQLMELELLGLIVQQAGLYLKNR